MALNKGINVICEKPAGVYTKQVKEMNEVAKNSNSLFAMMFNQRTNCLYRKMKEIISEGEIGQIKRINWIITDWYRSQSYYDSGDWRATWSGEGGGVLFNQCPHQLDLLSWVTGMMPKKVHAFCHYGKWHDIEVEDDVTAYLEYENGATGVFITSTADAPGTNRFEVLGSGGKLVAENNKLTLYKNDVDEREFNSTYKGGFGEPKFKVIEVETDGLNLQHTGICRNFTNAILGQESLFVDGKEGINGVMLMDAMQLSGWTGKAVDLPINDDLYLEILTEKINNSKVKKNVEEKVLDTSNSY
jgi:predicted dehydrogenase